jgi:hypothetical protein
MVAKMRENPMCGGNGPHSISQEVRVLPTSSMSNAIVCRLCFAREILFRKEENAIHGKNHFETPEWEALEAYEP